ncbi:hypothetical protein KP509_06G090400 [Ceratopteris richardii]|uniref:Uncharacterized protein n=1 Tax=Ceratopteris richardii TaxID=49495 RepID=A0A8T2URM9_CERRI|nr:hypothetical protein KP509_06G090400 [Ceratopteris richardii]
MDDTNDNLYFQHYNQQLYISFPCDQEATPLTSVGGNASTPKCKQRKLKRHPRPDRRSPKFIATNHMTPLPMGRALRAPRADEPPDNAPSIRAMTLREAFRQADCHTSVGSAIQHPAPIRGKQGPPPCPPPPSPQARHPLAPTPPPQPRQPLAHPPLSPSSKAPPCPLSRSPGYPPSSMRSIHQATSYPHLTGGPIPSPLEARVP